MLVYIHVCVCKMAWKCACMYSICLCVYGHTFTPSSLLPISKCLNTSPEAWGTMLDFPSIYLLPFGFFSWEEIIWRGFKFIDGNHKNSLYTKSGSAKELTKEITRGHKCLWCTTGQRGMQNVPTMHLLRSMQGEKKKKNQNKKRQLMKKFIK